MKLKTFAGSLFVVLSVIQACYSGVSLTPAQQETTTVYYDPLGISSARVVADQFSCFWFNHLLVLDSTVWLIDGAPPPNSGGIFIHEYGSIDSAYATCMHIDGYLASQLYSSGVHSVSLKATYVDSTILANWFFKYKRVRYKEVLADVVIDSFYTIGDPQSGFTSCTAFRIVHASEMDTSIFANTCTFQDTLIEYDTSRINYQFVSHNHSSRPFADTLHGFVFQSNPEDGISDDWRFSYRYSLFLQPDTSRVPFAIQFALDKFNDYLDRNKLPKAYITLTRPIKLGGIIPIGGGDQGWSLSASHDSLYWYFDHGVGQGDCPLGCSPYPTNHYMISEDGTVTDLSGSAVKNLIRQEPRTKTTPSIFYDLCGRMAKQRSAGVFVQIEKGKGSRLLFLSRDLGHQE